MCTYTATITETCDSEQVRGKSSILVYTAENIRVRDFGHVKVVTKSMFKNRTMYAESM